jgi:hypothetical protein
MLAALLNNIKNKINIKSHLFLVVAVRCVFEGWREIQASVWEQQ